MKASYPILRLLSFFFLTNALLLLNPSYSLLAQSTITQKCQVFSVRVPAGWTNDTNERRGVYSSVSSTNYTTNQRIEIGAFYKKKDPTDFLKEQIGVRSGSAFLRNADPKKIESFTFGSVSGKKIHVSGRTGGDSFVGDVYAFNLGGYLFNILNIGESYAFSGIGEIIRSISLNSSFSSASSSAEDFVAGAVRTLQSRTPYEYSQGLTATSVRIDKNKKVLYFDLQVQVPYDTFTLSQKNELVGVLKGVQKDQQALVRSDSSEVSTLYKSAFEIGYKIHFKYLSKKGSLIYEYDLTK